MLEDSVVVDGRVFDAEVTSPDNGLSRVELTMPQQWMVAGRPVPASIWFRGTARYEGPDFIGTMSSSATELVGCVVDVYLLGRAPIDEGGGD